MSKKLYITTAIPYVNAKPHVGHVMDYLIADIWARYQKQMGHEVRFQVGTDEHGNKIAAKARDVGQNLQVFVDENYAEFKKFVDSMNISYTDFIRTTDPKHQAAVQYIWQQLTPYIYKGTYEGWYCEGCESFVTDKEAAATNGVCPDHGKSYQRLSEENYYFKASEFSGKVREAIEAHKLKIVPEFRQKEFLNLIKDGMPDVSISRPKKSLSWGVPVPGDDTQVMYVWLDALANYITVLGYPEDAAWKDYWPADVQVVGKDIMRFHAGLWPAMLVGLGLPLPKVLLVHGHVTVGGAKMSKTMGNVVDPVEIINKFGAEALRYYFSRHVSTTEDSDFNWRKFEDAYNNELANDLGNLVSRTANMVTRYQAGVVGEIQKAEHDMFAYNEAMRELRFSDAIDDAWVLVQGANQFIDRVKPWEIAKSAADDPEEKEHLDEVLAHVVGSLLQAASMLYPFLPATSEKITDMFGTGVIKPAEGVLFPKTKLETAEAQPAPVAEPVVEAVAPAPEPEPVQPEPPVSDVAAG
ncbi:MAG: class I tRNA ligase family protein [Candidatus Nomurabacteria bacterium]|jgi:methionyl-tRNA synthetase|nr:class I tRNA ligase family protein [Candidatus Nomurabacteria bacterium]